MARLISFKSFLGESLKNDDVLGFQKTFKQHLNETLNQKCPKERRLIIEEDEMAQIPVDVKPEETAPNNSEMTMVSAVEGAAKTFGAHSFSYDEGVLTMQVPSKDACFQLMDYLDTNPDIYSYEVFNTNKDEGSPVDMEDENAQYELDCMVEVYFNADNVSLNPVLIDPDMKEEMDEEMDSGEEEEECDESKVPCEEEKDEEMVTEKLLPGTRTPVFHNGKMHMKVTCIQGRKPDPKNLGHCIVMEPGEIAKRKFGQRSGVIARRILQRQINKHRNHSIEIRHKTLGEL